MIIKIAENLNYEVAKTVGKAGVKAAKATGKVIGKGVKGAASLGGKALKKLVKAVNPTRHKIIQELDDKRLDQIELLERANRDLRNSQFTFLKRLLPISAYGLTHRPKPIDPYSNMFGGIR